MGERSAVRVARLTDDTERASDVPALAAASSRGGGGVGEELDC